MALDWLGLDYIALHCSRRQLTTCETPLDIHLVIGGSVFISLFIAFCIFPGQDVEGLGDFSGQAGGQFHVS